jgi:hypothetical protein
MTWLLYLYPPRWRRRYGAELGDLIAARPFSIGGALDLLAGAIDAWIHPELVAPATSESKGEVVMIARALHLKCAGYGPDITSSDKRKSAAVVVGGALVLTLLWLWAQWQLPRSPYVDAVAPMAFLAPFLLSLRYTSLKGRSARAQTVLIVGLGAALAAFFLLVGWVGANVI